MVILWEQPSAPRQVTALGSIPPTRLMAVTAAGLILAPSTVQIPYS